MAYHEVGRETLGPSLDAISSPILLELLRNILDEDDRDHTPVTNNRVWKNREICFCCGVLWPCAIERAERLLVDKGIL